MKKLGYTLAEIIIAIMVIGMVAIIALPSVKHSTPDENVAKFKKSHLALHNAISELAISEKYYLNGDLGIMPNGQLVKDSAYFCNTLADILQTKIISCSDSANGNGYIEIKQNNTNINNSKEEIDTLCASYKATHIVASNDTTFYIQAPNTTFGGSDGSVRIFNNPSRNCTKTSTEHCTSDNFYKIVCMDVDDTNSGETPFGYAVRADGKIINGAKADEWLKKDMYGKEQEDSV